MQTFLHGIKHRNSDRLDNRYDQCDYRHYRLRNSIRHSHLANGSVQASLSIETLRKSIIYGTTFFCCVKFPQSKRVLPGHIVEACGTDFSVPSRIHYQFCNIQNTHKAGVYALSISSTSDSYVFRQQRTCKELGIGIFSMKSCLSLNHSIFDLSNVEKREIPLECCKSGCQILSCLDRVVGRYLLQAISRSTAVSFKINATTICSSSCRSPTAPSIRIPSRHVHCRSFLILLSILTKK